MYNFDDFDDFRILVIGVGSGGNRAVDAMFSDVEKVDFMAVNTDNLALEKNYAKTKIQIGEKTLKGFGTNGNMETGRKAAEESLESIEKATEDYQVVLIVAGMGGGTGGGAASVIASAIKKKGILTIGVVTKPFLFEGTKRMQNAEDGIKKLKENVDTLIVIPNQRLINPEDKDIDINSLQPFRLADKILKQCIIGSTYLISHPGFIGVDFADVRTLMSREGGLASVGIGYYCGCWDEEKNRAKIAAEAACKSPLLEIPIEEANAIIITALGDGYLGLLELNKAAEFISNLLAPDAEGIFGDSFCRNLMKLGLPVDEGVIVIIIAIKDANLNDYINEIRFTG